LVLQPADYRVEGPATSIDAKSNKVSTIRTQNMILKYVGIGLIRLRMLRQPGPPPGDRFGLCLASECRFDERQFVRMETPHLIRAEVARCVVLS
jgi:hypothetical protein